MNAFATFDDLDRFRQNLDEGVILRSASARTGKTVFLAHSSKDERYLASVISVLEIMAGKSILTKRTAGFPNQQIATLRKYSDRQSKNAADLYCLLLQTARKASGSPGNSALQMEKRGIIPLHCSRRLIEVRSNNGLSKNISGSTGELSGVK
jgi:hypothetical protein